MTDPLRAAIASLRERTLALDQLAQEIGAKRLLFDLRGLSPIQSSRPADRGEDRRPLKASLMPEQVERGWRDGGADWLAGLGRRDLAAVAIATADSKVGPILADNPYFPPLLLARLRGRRRFTVLGRLVFQFYPPPAHLIATLATLCASVPEDRSPAWALLAVRSTEELVLALAARVVVEGWPAAGETLEVPDAACRGAWALAITERARIRQLDEGERLLRFTDGGREMYRSAPLTDAGRQAARALVSFAKKEPSARLRVAEILRERVADVFGVVDLAAWRGLEPERDQIRRWVAAETLDILFKHLVPSNEHAHHTEPRRVFWQGYTGRVDRLWLLVEPGMRRRLQRPDLRELLDRVGDLVEIRDLEGAGEQAIVWMHLRADGGGIVTVIEGNANASCRARVGAVEPPHRRVGGRLVAVHYSYDIVQDLFAVDRADFVRAHHRGWERHLNEELRSLGVRP